jgi:hypothetical protein
MPCFRAFFEVPMAKSPEKPPFSVVSALPVQIPDPPRPLGIHGRQLWDRTQREYQIVDVGGAELLSQACAAEDTAESLAEAIARDGHVIHSRTGVPRTHPAVKDELACRAFVVRTLERLGLNVEAVKSPGRPPGGGLGWIPPR